jgi:hypothetical protein
LVKSCAGLEPDFQPPRHAGGPRPPPAIRSSEVGFTWWALQQNMGIFGWLMASFVGWDGIVTNGILGFFLDFLWWFHGIYRDLLGLVWSFPEI